jgi:SAM-dependent methyltransferase
MTKMQNENPNNYDPQTVRDFGNEWSWYDQSALPDAELQELFSAYFQIFPWDKVPANAVGFDMGCGSGRWARVIAPRVGMLYCIDGSEAAIVVARRNLSGLPNCAFFVASFDNLPLAPSSMDFGYCLGVLHHIPDPLAGLKACVRTLKPNAPLLVYLYYALENRPVWFRALWWLSDVLRRWISRLPSKLKYGVSHLFAIAVYYPLARASWVAEKFGMKVDAFPLSIYRKRSFYTMRTDALDRFGTRVEKRFTAAQVQDLMVRAGLERICVGDSPPYWCAVGYRTPIAQ